jgi:hypothetical protein
VAGGPLIPGLREFDRPRRGWPRWLVWLIVASVTVVSVVMLAGLVGGVGPLRALGSTTTPLAAVGYRLTGDPAVIEVAVRLPESGLCRDDVIDAVAFERGARVELDIAVTRSRRGDCAVATIGGDVRWVPVTLDTDLGARTVIRVSDREPVPRED